MRRACAFLLLALASCTAPARERLSIAASESEQVRILDCLAGGIMRLACRRLGMLAESVGRRAGWNGRRVSQEAASGILVAALGAVEVHFGTGRSMRKSHIVVDKSGSI